MTPTSTRLVVLRLAASLLVLCVNLCGSMMIRSVSGAPVFGKHFQLSQPDGTTVDVRIWGDEFYRIVESLDGYTLVQDENSGFICYARLSDDANELVSTGIPGGDGAPLGLQPHIRLNADAISRKVAAARAQSVTIEKERASILALRNGPLAPPSTGNVRGICLIVDFPDESGTIQPSEVNNFCNQVGYSRSGNNGSVRDYFFDVSDGNLTYTNFVSSQYYTALHNKSYYDNPSEADGPKARELILEALNDLENNGFDFSQYDSNGDKVIDGINCLYAGSCASGWSMGLWPHSWVLSFGADGVSAYKYQITDMGSSLTLRTFCHENGHMVCEWPDLYDYGYESTGVGDYCLMASGASDTDPVEPCAYLKDLSGWSNTILLTSNLSATITAAGSPWFDKSNMCYKFEYGGLPNEYFLIEYRQQAARDTEVPDSGLAIWHVDTRGSNDNQQMTSAQHYRVSLEQADGKSDLENNRNNGDATDLWGAPQHTQFGPLTSPNTTWWDGSGSGMTISSISSPDAFTHTMTFSFAVTREAHPPVLSNPRVEPRSGSTSTTFEFLVDYYDPDGDPPLSDYSKVFLSRGQEGTMTLKSGAPANGTYHYLTALPADSYSYLFSFTDATYRQVGTSLQSGPVVYPEGNVVINIVIRCKHVPLDLKLKYSLNGIAGPWVPIRVTKEILDPILVPAGSAVCFNLVLYNLNYDYLGWEAYKGGQRLDGDSSNNWCLSPSTDTTDIDVNIDFAYTPQPYTVSGKVLRWDGIPVPGGVDLTLTSPEQTLTQHTDDGNFCFSGVLGGVSVTVTPSAGGYQFSPSSLVFSNLEEDRLDYLITAHSSDEYVPMTTFLMVPPAVSPNSAVSFSWRGEDDVTNAQNLVYQYKLDGQDADWPTDWVSSTSTSCNLANGAYTFWVRPKDEAGNINQDPPRYKFVVNAAPKVKSAVRIPHSVWASRVTLEMPSGASHPTDKFVLLPEHSGTSDSELVPLKIHPADAPAPCGANEIVATELGLTLRMTKAATGWLVTLPESIPSGQTAQYDIVWGKIKYFGWQEKVEIPRGFPNFSPGEPNYTGSVEAVFLTEQLRLLRLAEKERNRLLGVYGTKEGWMYMNVWDQSGPFIDETVLQFLMGEPSYASDYECLYGSALQLGENICLTWWNDKEQKVDGLTHEYYRYCLRVFDAAWNTLNSFESDFEENSSPNMVLCAIEGRLIRVGKTYNDPANTVDLWFVVHDSDGSNIVPRTVFASVPQTESADLYPHGAKRVGKNVALLFEHSWETAEGDNREEVLYQVRDTNGVLVKQSESLNPPLLPDSVEMDDEYEFETKDLTDNEGKLWMTIERGYRPGQGFKWYYCVIKADGNVWEKRLIERPNRRYFDFCDRDGYVWIREEAFFAALNPDDTVRCGPRTVSFIPVEDVGGIPASVWETGYRLYDRWSPQVLQIDVPSGLNVDSIELFDLNLWANDLHPANVKIKKADTVVWSQSGQFTGHTTVDLPAGTLAEGGNVLTASQDDFLGGQVLFTFPYVPPPPEITEVSRPDAGTVRLTWKSYPGKTYIVQSCVNLVPDSWTQKATVPSAGETTTWSETIGASRMRFYRVQVQ